MSLSPIIVIPARLAATRLPDKPLADIGGEPMIVHVWRRAIEADLGPVLVACGDTPIQEAIEAAGGRAVMTRSDHPSGTDRIYEAVAYVDPFCKYDVVVNLQGDLPTIDPAVIRAALAPLADEEVDIATLAFEIEDEAEKENPNVVKAVIDLASEGKPGRATDFTRKAMASSDGRFYHHVGLYAYRRTALEEFVSLPPSPREYAEKLEQLRALEAGMRIDVALVDRVAPGVDTPSDLEEARKALAPGT